MIFWDYETYYSLDKKSLSEGLSRQQRQQLRQQTPQSYYEQASKARFLKARAAGRELTDVEGVDHTAQMIEASWYASGRPYYRIFPPYIDVFSRTSLNVPCKYIKTPYASFVIRFPQGHEPLLQSQPVRALLVSLLPPDPAKRSAETHRDAMLVLSVQASREGQQNSGSSRSAFSSPLLGFRLYEDRTVDEAIHHGVAESKTLLLTKQGQRMDDGHALTRIEAFDPLLRIAVAVMFLATGGDKVISPDVLGADLAKYLEAVRCQDQATLRRLQDKAVRRRGQLGFTVGREHYATEGILGRTSQGLSSGNAEASRGRELSYQHQRCGHLHLYWTGPGRATPEMKFVSQITVRADLPPSQVAEGKARGFRTLPQRQKQQ